MTPLGARCPICPAMSDEYCTNKDGYLRDFHEQRYEAVVDSLHSHVDLVNPARVTGP